MAKRDDTNTLVVPLDQCSFSLIDLPNDYNKSLSKLVDHAKSIIAANETHYGRKCGKFYIGKSTMHTWSGRHFDPHNRYTWKTELIRQRWDARRKHGYQAMAVLTVITKDTLPPLKSRRPAQWKQQYTLALEQAVITHFMFVEDDERLENETTVPGNLDRSGAVAYVLYLAMKFEDAQDPGLNPARESEDDTLDLSSWILIPPSEPPQSWVLVPPSTPTQSPSKQGSTHGVTVPQKSHPTSPNTASKTSTTGVTVPQKSHPSSPNTASTTSTTGVTVPQKSHPTSPNTASKTSTTGVTMPQKSHPSSPNTASTTNTTGVTMPQKSFPSSPNTATKTNTTGVTVPGYMSPPSPQYCSKVVTNHLHPANLPTNVPKSSHFIATDQDVTRSETPILKHMHKMGSACRSLFNNTTPHPTNPTFQSPTPFVPRDLTLTFQTVSPAAPGKDTGIKPCKCGSTTHRITSHHECPLRRLTCRCGSTSHQRTNHHDCPLNKKHTT